ncbi:MAG: RecX family transcriptional regulator [Chitinophagales bacterium]|nr:RecX family transcriptional regulator [Chitinophagales bacterium]
MGHLKKQVQPYQFKEGHEKEIISRLERYCAYTERCESDVIKKMKSWNVPEHLFAETINFLKENKYILESRYGQLFVNGKFKIKNWGKQKIKAALIAKQIDENIIESSLEGIDENNYTDRLHQLLESKVAMMKEEDIFTMKGKLYRYAIQKGYESHLVMQWINSYFLNK